MSINYARLPEHMREATREYIEHGKRTGDFLHAIFSNDFIDVLMRADSPNHQCLRDWAFFLLTQVPSECHGSGKKYEAWIKKGGLNGKENT